MDARRTVQPGRRMKTWSGIFAGLIGVMCLAQESLAFSASPLKLEWQSSDDDTVTGYAVYFGAVGAPMTNRVDVGLSNSAVLNGLSVATEYELYVVAYDSDEIESAPSNFLSYTAEAISALQLIRSAAGTMMISFKVAPNATCHVEYTDTLIPPNWQWLTWASSDSNGVVTVTDPAPAPDGCRFYRAAIDLLEVDYYDIP